MYSHQRLKRFLGYPIRHVSFRNNRQCPGCIWMWSSA